MKLLLNYGKPNLKSQVNILGLYHVIQTISACVISSEEKQWTAFF